MAESGRFAYVAAQPEAPTRLPFHVTTTNKRSNYLRTATHGQRLSELEALPKYMQTLTLGALLNAEDGGYVALCPELDIASQGDSIDQALANLKEAVEGFLEVASQKEIDGRLKKPSLFTHFEVTRG